MFWEREEVLGGAEQVLKQPYKFSVQSIDSRVLTRRFSRRTGGQPVLPGQSILQEA